MSHELNPDKEFSYGEDRWMKSKKNVPYDVVEETEWANDSIWPGYWRSHADFPISYDFLTLKLLGIQNFFERATPPCPNMSYSERHKMFLFRPYSSRTCHLRSDL